MLRRLPLAGAALAVAAAYSVSATAQAAAKPAQVVRAWSAALNANDNVRAGRLFALDAHVIQPGVDAVLSTHALAVAFSDALPCAGKVERIIVKGTSALAIFRLGHRPKHQCDAPGHEAAALFIIRGGKIVVWQQVPVPKPKSPTA